VVIGSMTLCGMNARHAPRDPGGPTGRRDRCL